MDETRSVLLDRAHRRFGVLPEALIVEHVLHVTREADFPVREAALAAVERRWTSAEREELMVAKRPARGVLGAYTTARKSKEEGGRREARPYSTTLTSLSP